MVAACTEPVTLFKWQVAGGDADLGALSNLTGSTLIRSFLMVGPGRSEPRGTAVEEPRRVMSRKRRFAARVLFVPALLEVLLTQ